MRRVIAVICHIKRCMLANTNLASLVITTALSGWEYLPTTQHKRDAEINLDAVQVIFVLFVAWDDGREALISIHGLIWEYSDHKIENI